MTASKQQKIKKIISFFLLFAFVFPIASKFYDSLFHHHEIFVCTAQKDEKHFHKKIDKCDVLNFIQFTFTNKKQKSPKTKLKPTEIPFPIFSDFSIINTTKYSFLLRAPPIAHKI